MKKIILALVFLLVFCGCASSDAGNISESVQSMESINQDFTELHKQIITDKGVYFVNPADDRLYFMDFEKKKALPLCNKINCSHEDSDCNAVFDFFVCICEYGGQLYIVAASEDGLGVSLYKMKYDGSDRTELKHLTYYDENDTDIASLVYEFRIFSGSGYFICNKTSMDWKEEMTQTMYKIGLDSSDEMEEIFSVTGKSSFLSICGSGERGIYLLYSYLSEERENRYINYLINADTLKAEELSEPVNAIHHVRDDKIFYYDGNDYMRYDTDSHSAKKMFGSDNRYIPYYDNDCMYFDTDLAVALEEIPPDERKIYVVDYDGNVIGAFEGAGELGTVAIKDGMLVTSDYEDEPKFSFFEMK